MAPGLNAKHRALVVILTLRKHRPESISSDVVDDLSHQTPFVPRVTKEMAENNIAFEETEAGKALESDVKRLNKKLEEIEKEMLDKTKALDDREKEMREAIATEKENARKLQEKFDAEMAREKQTAKEEQARMTRMFTEAQAKADLELKRQHEISEANMKAMMDRASAERLDMQRRFDAAQSAAQQSLNYDIQRLGNLIAQEVSSRKAAEQRASTLQKEVRELERDWEKLDKQNDKLLDKLIKAEETEERLRRRIRNLQ